MSLFAFCSLTAPKVKNIEKSIKGDKLGRIHMKKQNLDSMGGRRMDALRKNKRSREENDGSSNKKSKI
jgi:ribosome production factor 2